MPATKLSATKRFALFGNRAWVFVPTIASPAAPTRTELDAGTDLSAEIKAIDGFNKTTNFIETPDAGGADVGKIPGRNTLADSTITFYEDEEGDDVRTLLTERLDGFIVIYNAGDIADNLMDVWPITVSSVSEGSDLEDAAQVMVGFATTSSPQQGLSVPAHSGG